MNKKGMFFLTLSLLIACSFCSCPLGNLPTGAPISGTSARDIVPGPTSVPIGSGAQFNVLTNPIINRFDPNIDHFSSDPSVEVIPNMPAPGGGTRDLIVLISSTDLEEKSTDENGWPMNGAHIYTTYGRNNLSRWYTYKNSDLETRGFIDESAFPWIRTGSHNFFAPDIQYVPKTSNKDAQLYFYFPDHEQGKDGEWHIGVAHAETTESILYRNLFAEDGYFNIQPGPGGNPPDKPVGNPGDPGVFHDKDQNKYYMVYVDTPYSASKNISMVQLNDDMKSGRYLGKIKFAGDITHDSYYALNKYMEGPDIFRMTTPINQTPYYYLLFVARVESGNDPTEYIGYAIAKPDDFTPQSDSTDEQLKPTRCWQFKGWIFKNLGTGLANHATLAQANGHNYVFYHGAFPHSNGTPGWRREVCVKEFDLAEDGTIVGVTIPSASLIKDPKNAWMCSTLDGKTNSILKGFIDVRDESKDNDKAIIHFSSLTNTGNIPQDHFQLLYYVDIEEGRNLTVTMNKSTNFSLPTRYLRHIDGRTWAIVLDYKEWKTLNPGETLIGEDIITLRYDSGSLDKKNDFSQPLGDYFSRTTRIAFFYPNVNLSMYYPYLGEIPCYATIPDLAPTKYLRTEHLDSTDRYTYLTCMQTEADHGVNNQYLNTGKATQEWVFEPVPEGTKITTVNGYNVYAPAYAYRVRSARSENYLTCNNIVNRGGDIAGEPYYWLMSQKLHPDWTTQIWIKSGVGGKIGYFRLRSMWEPNNSLDTKPVVYPLYMTLTYDPNNPSSDKGDHSVYLQQRHNDWSTQRWIME